MGSGRWGEVDTEAVQVGQSPFLDVPVVADLGEIDLGGPSCLDDVQGCAHPIDPEQFGDGRPGGQGQRLGQVSHVPVDRDGPGGRGEVSGDQSEQSGLAGSVPADQPGAPASEGGVQTGERDGAVRPGVGEPVADDGACHGASRSGWRWAVDVRSSNVGPW